jgi:hypothetical protein
MCRHVGPSVTVRGMSGEVEDERVEQRAAHLLPEEEASGSDDPTRQAEAILRDSDERTADPERARRESAQTPDPAEG